MFKVLFCISFLSGALLLTGCNTLSATTSPESAFKPMISYAETSVYADQVAKIIAHVRPADNGTIVIIGKDKDPKVRALEKGVETQLQSNGYAVQHVLPLIERQKGDVNELKPNAGYRVNIDLIDYRDSAYTELAVDAEGVRYSRLFAVKDQNVAPVSNWIRRQKELEDFL